MKIKIKRLISVTIDLTPFVLFVYLTAPIFNVDFFLFDILVIKIVLVIVYYGLLGLAICTKDIIFGYESIGKKIMKLEIVNQDGEKEKNKSILFQRNFYSLFNLYWGLYPYMILFNNKSWGDYKTNLTIKSISE